MKTLLSVLLALVALPALAQYRQNFATTNTPANVTNVVRAITKSNDFAGSFTGNIAGGTNLQPNSLSNGTIGSIYYSNLTALPGFLMPASSPPYHSTSWDDTSGTDTNTVSLPQNYSLYFGTNVGRLYPQVTFDSLGSGARTYYLPRTMQWLTDNPWPYRLASHFGINGDYNTAAWVIISNKRGDNGLMMPCETAPTMLAVSSDINGPTVGIESHADMIGTHTNSTAITVHDLDAQVSGTLSTNGGAYFYKKFAITGNGTMLWGTNLSTTPATNSTLVLLPTNGIVQIKSNFFAAATTGVSISSAGALAIGGAIGAYALESHGSTWLAGGTYMGSSANTYIADNVVQGNSGLNIQTTSGGNINLLPNTTGVVGVGTSNPDGKLTVNGDIRASTTITATNGFASFSTNQTLSVSSTGATNTLAVNYIFKGVTGTSIIESNYLGTIGVSRGTITVPTDILLKPNACFVGTSVAAQGGESW